MSGPKKILIVEDDLRIAQNISKGLIEKGFETEIAFDGKIGLKLALHNDFDLILLDLMLPSLDGIEICKMTRSAKINTPIIMITSKSEEIDRVIGLETGADDYIVKPFSIREFQA